MHKTMKIQVLILAIVNHKILSILFPLPKPQYAYLSSEDNRIYNTETWGNSHETVYMETPSLRARCF